MRTSTSVTVQLSSKNKTQKISYCSKYVYDFVIGSHIAILSNTYVWPATCTHVHHHHGPLWSSRVRGASADLRMQHMQAGVPSYRVSSHQPLLPSESMPLNLKHSAVPPFLDQHATRGSRGLWTLPDTQVLNCTQKTNKNNIATNLTSYK